MLLAKKLIPAIVSLTIITGVTVPTPAAEQTWGTKVSGGEDHTLVLTESKAVWGCGYNLYYQLGIGDDSAAKYTLIRVHDGDMNTASDYLEHINDIDAGWMHSLALDVNGFVWAWGWNEYGQLGDSSTHPNSTPVQVHGPNDANYLENIIAISAGRSGLHSLAVDANNFIWAWGRNEEGQLGNGESGSKELTPVRVFAGEQDPNASYLKNVIAVSAGEQHSMAFEKLEPNDSNCNGHVYTWGHNDYGQLGTNVPADIRNTPVKVLKGKQQNSSDYLKNIVGISAGWDHCMALEKYDPCDFFDMYPDPNYITGRVYTWGNNRQGWDSQGGRLGDGTYDDSNTPVLVLSGLQDPNNPDSPLTNIIAISAGEGHCMALDVTGFVWTWGDNKYGQLGNGTNDPCTTPVKVVGLNGVGYLEYIVAVSAGFWHCLAVDVHGTIWTWGTGNGGQLGLADASDRNTPHPIPVVRNLTWGTTYFHIQAAIDDANNGDIIEASLGTYPENIDFLDKTLTVKSINPDNSDIVVNTIINGDGGAVVTFDNNPGSVLSGFTIKNGYYGINCVSNSSPLITNCIIQDNRYGVRCDNSSPQITNCTIEDSAYHGVTCRNSSSLIISDSIIQDNGSSWNIHGHGIYCDDSDANIVRCVVRRNDYGLDCTGTSSLALKNSFVMDNRDSGIYCGRDSTAAIKNNWIYHNGGPGIWCSYVASPPLIRNNTIVDNADYGIEKDWGAAPNISNCIIWGNTDGQLQNCTAIYSCIQNGDTSNGNINTDPLFYDDPNDPNNYHLSSQSPCIDTGDPNFEPNDPNETDIDGEKRVIDGDANGTAIVDMGADEFYWSPADFDGDEIVNFFDYAVFASAWRTTPGESNYNDTYDLADNNSIDYNDLRLFCKDWLWEPAWEKSYASGFDRGMGAMGSISLQLLEETATFYALEPVTAATSQPQEIEPVDLEEILKWLDEIWLNDDLKELISEHEYLKFRKAIEKSLK